MWPDMDSITLPRIIVLFLEKKDLFLELVAKFFRAIKKNYSLTASGRLSIHPDACNPSSKCVTKTTPHPVNVALVMKQKHDPVMIGDLILMTVTFQLSKDKVFELKILVGFRKMEIIKLDSVNLISTLWRAQTCRCTDLA